MRKTLLIGTLLAGLASGEAPAQVMYNGWNVGPDYGAMIDQVNRERHAQTMAMQQLMNRIVGEAMQDPACQSAYRQHQARGGGMAYPDFAFLCAATNRFDPEGIRQFRMMEAQNQSAEARQLAALRLAEHHRGRAQRGLADGDAAGQGDAGDVMQGNSTWTDPRTGQRVVLPYLGGPISRDPATGRFYGRDPQGRQYALGPDGLWYPLSR